VTLRFERVLVANRGEIALRVFRALRELGIGCVAVYSEPDRDALHVRRADDAYLLGPGSPSESYLHHDRVIDAARRAGADAIHPGYGFLAENAAFARRCAHEGIVWIGPSPDAIDAMGSKIRAREIMQAASVPIVPGTIERVADAARVVELGGVYGWPIALKAAAGGGGKGLKVVAAASDAERMLEAARREGLAYFGDASVYVEKYLEDPRHIEVQVMADQHGNVVALGERDCTLQRRHQKIVEETPSPAVTPTIRERLAAMAIAAARAVGYVGAGTIECLMDRHDDVFFLEMNTRIQVEHTITEMVTGIDLVREQVLVATGQPLSFAASEITLRGHAIECRINAEDPLNGFLPSPGRVTRYREPSGPGVRVDSALEQGGEILPFYDPMVAKLVVWDRDRDHARARMRRALDEMVVDGVKTLIPLHRLIMESAEFARGETCAGMVEQTWPAALADASAHPACSGHDATGVDAPGSELRVFVAEVDGRRFQVRVHAAPDPVMVEARRRRAERQRRSHAGGGPGAVQSPMQGTVLKVNAADGDEVTQGKVLMIVEAMKMENEILAPRAGVIRGLAARPGQTVTAGQTVCRVEEPDAT
jgi:acetyl-CoA/propionyl-CoA carboxylase, biotin carboxylase, biotin carboxyl carrier protein